MYTNWHLCAQIWRSRYVHGLMTLYTRCIPSVVNGIDNSSSGGGKSRGPKQSSGCVWRDCLAEECFKISPKRNREKGKNSEWWPYKNRLKHASRGPEILSENLKADFSKKCHKSQYPCWKSLSCNLVWRNQRLIFYQQYLTLPKVGGLDEIIVIDDFSTWAFSFGLDEMVSVVRVDLSSGH